MDKLNIYDNTVVRTLMQLIPYGSAVDVVTMDVINRIRNRRTRIFFDKLGSFEIDLTEKLIQDDIFIHNYICTAKAFLNTERKEKIEYFAILFASGIENNLNKNEDEYEFYLKILDELSYKEIKILTILNNYERESVQVLNDIQSKLKQNKVFWPDFVLQIKDVFEIEQNELESLLIRIERTGCIYLPRTSANDLRGHAAVTTDIYKKFRKYLRE